MQQENFPTLYTNKGTIIRIILTCKDGSEHLIDPLKECAAGLSLSNNFASKFISDVRIENAKELCVTLLSSDGTALKKISLNAELTEIMSFVIYPDGSTWEGNVGDNLENLGVMLWSPSLISSINDSAISDNFFRSNHWVKTPTSLMAWHDGISLMGCSRIEHTCGKLCD